MLPSPGIDELASSMAQRSENRQSLSYGKRVPAGKPAVPYILFLGGEFARAAGVPGVESLALRYFKDTASQARSSASTMLDPSLLEQAARESGPDAPSFDWRDPPPATREVTEMFYKQLSRMRGEVRRTTLQRLYGDTRVPQPYQDLATLVKRGHFTRVLTTNLDTMLEKALELQGVSGGYYDVIDLGDKGSRVRSSSSSHSVVSIIRLPGHPMLDQAGIGPGDIGSALDAQGEAARRVGGADVVMAGADPACPPFNAWLSESEGELWWASYRPPDTSLLGQALDRRQLREIRLDDVKLEALFVQLLLRLRQGTPLESVQETSTELDSLRDQLNRARQVLANLRGRVARGDTGARSELQAQEQVVESLENELLRRSQPQVMDLMERLTAAASGESGDPSALSVLQSQTIALKRAYADPNPDKYLIASSIAGAVSVANSLGPDVVDPRLAADLQALAPGLPGRSFGSKA